MRDTSNQQKTDSAPWEQAERLKCIIDGTNIGYMGVERSDG